MHMCIYIYIYTCICLFICELPRSCIYLICIYLFVCLFMSSFHAFFNVFDIWEHQPATSSPMPTSFFWPWSWSWWPSSISAAQQVPDAARNWCSIPDSNLGPQNIPGFNETKAKCLPGPTWTHSQQKGIRMKLGDGHSFHTPKKVSWKYSVYIYICVYVYWHIYIYMYVYWHIYIYM